MSDARHAWAAHYAAVKARIATGQRPGAAAPPAPAPAPAPPADPPVLYKTNTAWIKLTRAEHAALPHVQARAAKLSDKAARRARMDERMARYRLTAQELEDLCIDIAVRHKTTWLAITGRSTSDTLLRPRLEVYRRLLALGWSYTAIGKACGRDHSTVMYYIRRWGTTDEQAQA